MTELTPTQELINLARDEFNISYGLDFTIPDDAPANVRVVGGLKVREYEETPAGLLILRTLITRAQSALQDDQQESMLNHATKLLADFPELLPDFNAAYQSLNILPEEASNSAAFVQAYNKVRKGMQQLVERQVDKMRRVSDLAFCYFLQKVALDDKVWSLNDLYALGSKSRKDLGDYMAQVVGLLPEVEEDEDDTLKGASDEQLGTEEGKTL